MGKIDINAIVLELIEQTKKQKIKWEYGTDRSMKELSGELVFSEEVSIKKVYFTQRNTNKFFITENSIKNNEYMCFIICTENNGFLIYIDDEFHNPAILKRLTNLIIDFTYLIVFNYLFNILFKKGYVRIKFRVPLLFLSSHVLPCYNLLR